MGDTVGRETDALTFLAALEDAPYRHDFYQTLRRLECLYAQQPRWGRALRPVDEPVRLGQDPDLAFPVSSLASLERREGQVPRLQVRLFGLFGPNGALPTHITEYARERLRHADDPTLCRFIDVIQHRFIALFYRAWAEAQPTVNRDRPNDDRFSTYIGSFVGLAPASVRGRDAVPDVAKLFHAGALVRQVRNADGLAQVLEHFFRVPVRIEQFVGHWMTLGRRERTRLARSSAILGSGAVLGGRVWDRQHKFRVHLGPLTMAQYEGFLPGAALLRPLVDWIRQYFCFEFDWDVRLALAQSAVPRLTLGGRQRLGWTTWLGEHGRRPQVADLCIDAEAHVSREDRAA
jgi:type VI secretion system protein ImpH